jgi:pimeloyl-ACP methyl ester carboxylesterase
MTTYVLIPGAGGAAWYWHLVVPPLEAAGHRAIPVELPADDEQEGLPEYARLVLDVVADHDDVVLVAQSLGGFTAPLVAAARAPRAIVLVNAMVPLPGETPGAWWDHTGQEAARVDAARQGGWTTEFDVGQYFLHDVPPEVVASGEPHQRPEAEVVFGDPCAIQSWPDVPTRVVAGADDRFFPVEFQRRLARERLGLEVDVLPGGHLNALSHPAELAAYLLDV